MTTPKKTGWRDLYHIGTGKVTRSYEYSYRGYTIVKQWFPRADMLLFVVYVGNKKISGSGHKTLKEAKTYIDEHLLEKRKPIKRTGTKNKKSWPKL